MVLRRAGYEVLEASTGKEGLKAARAHRPDVVLLDVVLPDISGIEACRQIKEDQDLKEHLCNPHLGRRDLIRIPGRRAQYRGPTVS